MVGGEVSRGRVEAAIKVLGGVAVTTARSSAALGPARGNIRGASRGVIICLLSRRQDGHPDSRDEPLSRRTHRLTSH